MKRLRPAVSMENFMIMNQGINPYARRRFKRTPVIVFPGMIFFGFVSVRALSLDHGSVPRLTFYFVKEV
jgi:hypothetical protein